MAGSLWIRVGRPCWHIPTAQRMVIAAVMCNRTQLLLKSAGRPLRQIRTVPEDIRPNAPVKYRPRMKRPEPLIVDNRPFTEDELRTAAAWKIDPQEVRRIRQEGKRV